MEFFTYLVDRLRAAGAERVKVFGGGGGVILPEEARSLEAAGVEKIYTPGDGMRLGVEGMIRDLLERLSRRAPGPLPAGPPSWTDRLGLSRLLTAVLDRDLALPGPEPPAAGPGAPVVGLTGTGGAGKSSLCDELVRRFLLDDPGLRVGVLAVDPIRKRTGGALLGDRLRVNTAGSGQVFFRSLAAGPGASQALRRGIALLRRVCGLVLVETTGIGQGDTDVVELCGLPVYVMTSEFGAGTQLEKINMLDYARLVAVNKFEDKRAEDALAAVRRQVRRNRGIPARCRTSACRSTPPRQPLQRRGVDRLYLDLLALLREHGSGPWPTRLPDPGPAAFYCERTAPIIPFERTRYLQQIVQAVRGYKGRTRPMAAQADQLQALETALGACPEAAEPLCRLAGQARAELGAEGVALLEAWPALVRAYSGDVLSYPVRDHTLTQPLAATTLSGTRIPKVELPRTDRWGAILTYLRQEQVPGQFPYTAGVFPLRRGDEEPKRQFAGEGGPGRTNRPVPLPVPGRGGPPALHRLRFGHPVRGGPGRPPGHLRQSGESGVSVATLDDMKALFAGFDLCDPATSVSMTINGPAPVILAMFFNAAVDQRLDAWRREHGADPDPGTAARIRAEALASVRGTVQADILKEDQAQNTCIFSIEFALRMMGDVQAFLIANRMLNFYSVSISGYHIAEAGANPVTQLAFTLANGFTLVEHYLSRGMAIDDITPNLSFFFSSGLDPEYAVLGRVARRIWAIAMKDVYGAREASRKLKYHVQTSGRSLHLKDMKFNDIRTTLQALTALTDNCNSLHTNAYDEALTTPTEASVRLAMAIQLIITREFGAYANENPLQGSHFIERLTDDVEEAVLEEFLNLNAHGGVLRAMETQVPAGAHPGAVPALRDPQALGRAAGGGGQHLPGGGGGAGVPPRNGGAGHPGGEGPPPAGAAGLPGAPPGPDRPRPGAAAGAGAPPRQPVRGAHGNRAGRQPGPDHRRTL